MLNRREEQWSQSTDTASGFSAASQWTADGRKNAYRSLEPHSRQVRQSASTNWMPEHVAPYGGHDRYTSGDDSRHDMRLPLKAVSPIAVKQAGDIATREDAAKVSLTTKEEYFSFLKRPGSFHALIEAGYSPFDLWKRLPDTNSACWPQLFALEPPPPPPPRPRADVSAGQAVLSDDGSSDIGRPLSVPVSAASVPAGDAASWLDRDGSAETVDLEQSIIQDHLMVDSGTLLCS